MIRVLVVEHPHFDLHRLRSEARQAGVCLLLTGAEDRGSFAAGLATSPDVVLLSIESLPGVPFHDLAEMAHREGTAVMVVGGDTPSERELLGRKRALFDESCRVTGLPHLPLLLERLARERMTRNERDRYRAESTLQLHQAAEQVRDLHKMATVGQLAGSIAHEINNPLESITNLIYLMSSDESFPEHMRPFLDLAQQELNRVAQISKQTLSYFRESQTPLRVELSSLVEEVLVLYGRRLSEKKIEVERQFESEEPVLVFPGEIRQVIANLLANAIEATAREGRLVVRLHRAHDSRGAAGMRVTVADSGHGIPQEALRRLGQPFFTTKGAKGTGLGLWVSQNIVQGYGGAMRLRSSTHHERHGTTFSLFLPFERKLRLVEINGGRRGANSPMAPEEQEDAVQPGNGGLQLLANATYP